MASFQKRGKTWQFTVSNKGEPIRKSGFKTKKEAQIAAAEVEDSLNKGSYVIQKDKPFADYLEQWINLYKTKIADSTLNKYYYTLKVVRDYFKGTPIQNIKRPDYQEFINYIGEGRSKETMQKINTHIRSCVADAVEDQVIHADFTRKVNLYWTTSAKRPSEKHLNYKESQDLIAYIMDNLHRGLTYYLLLLGITTGMRFSELLGLTRNDFDFENNTINVDKTWGYLKESGEGFLETKNEQSIRTISVNDKTMQEFRKLFMSTPDNIHRLVFFSPQSKYKVISNNSANRVLKQASDQLKIPHITVHGLRHTHAGILLYKKATVNYVSERLGHSNVEITWNTYSHILDEMREEDEQLAREVFDNLV